MRIFFLILFVSILLSCESSSNQRIKTDLQPRQEIVSSKKFEEQSWQYFLQHLPLTNGPVLDYKGKPVSYQEKHFAIVNYDVGRTDLQQCADALMRLRAEYLFRQQRYSEIGFHFVSGRYYSWDDYCKGLKVLPDGNNIKIFQALSCSRTHESLRKYLDIVYTYASTISLAKELKKKNIFEVGTVVIFPGSPGHCFIIFDEAIDNAGEKVFKLVEGYSPAQSIYVLRNIDEESINPWYHLSKGSIRTASFEFNNYQLGGFE